MKNKETLEEAAERYSSNELSKLGFINGAKWQQEQYTIEEQHVGHTIDELDKEYIKGFNEGSNYYIERMYSEEEVIKIVEKSRETGLTAEFLLLTEQYKKK